MFSYSFQGGLIIEETVKWLLHAVYRNLSVVVFHEVQRASSFLFVNLFQLCLMEKFLSNVGEEKLSINMVGKLKGKLENFVFRRMGNFVTTIQTLRESPCTNINFYYHELRFKTFFFRGIWRWKFQYHYHYKFFL